MEENLNNNKETIKKSKSKKAKVTVITLSAILVLALGLQVYAGANGYGNVFFMIRDLTTTKDASGANEVFIEEKTEEKELDINSEEVKKLYNYILKENSEIEIYAYQSKKITVNELDNDTKLCTVLSNLEDKDADDKKTIQGVAGKLNQFFYNQSTIDKKVNEIFGTKVNLKYKSIDDIATMVDYTYENNQYVKAEIQQGGGNYPAHTVEYIVKAEKDNDELMIYDKFCYLYDNQNAAYDIYNGSDKNEVFAKNISGEKIYFQVHDRDENLNKKVIDNIEKIVGKQVLTYKHTFKKNLDGNYYWYSTEPLKDTTNTTNTSNISTNETVNNTNKNEQLEPDNYAEEVMKDEQQEPTNYITSINWKRYESTDDGFSFAYPDDYTIVKSPDRGIVVEISGEAIGKDIDTGKEIKSNFKIRMYSTRNVEAYEIRDILERGTGYTNKNGDKWYTNYLEGYNTPGSAGYQKIENYVNYEDIGNGMYRQRMIEFEADNRDNMKITNIINYIIGSIKITEI